MTLRKEIEERVVCHLFGMPINHDMSFGDSKEHEDAMQRVADALCSLIKERLEKIIYITRLNDCTCYTPIKNLTEELE